MPGQRPPVPPMNSSVPPGLTLSTHRCRHLPALTANLALELAPVYHRERNHQGLDNRLIIQEQLVADRAAAIQRRSRWGGMLNYY